MKIEQISIDVSNYCRKGCPFCYNSSNQEGATSWKVDEIIAFAKSCIENGVKAISLGGGEPLDYDGIFDVIAALYPLCYVTLTTNGLPLDRAHIISALKLHKPDKIHISIHHVDDGTEVCRVLRQVELLNDLSIKPGVNLLVNDALIEKSKVVYMSLRHHLSSDQIILIPQRFGHTPSPKQLAEVSNGEPFQSPSCILGCSQPVKFASVSWDKKANWCSYAGGKQALPTLDYNGLVTALRAVHFEPCN